MTLDDFKRQQARALKEARRVAKTDKGRAEKEARARLRAAKIIDKNDKLARPYC